MAIKIFFSTMEKKQFEIISVSNLKLNANKKAIQQK